MYDINNRRYTGSKYKLLDWIEELILNNCDGESFFDVFAGTGIVSVHMSKYYKKVIMNDFLFSNEIIYKAFLGSGEYNIEVIEKYKKQFQTINPSKLKDNYFSENFGGKYFSYNDAKLIGEIREEIKRLKEGLTDREYCILLASLLYSMDKIANTVGHYDAYRKRDNIQDKFIYELINAEKTSDKFVIYRMDANKLVRKIKADIAFIDPPYNSRQYSRFYHVLENVVQWKKPRLEGVALKPQAENMSDYCRSNAPEVFADLIKNIDVKYIVVTYNNTYNSKSSSSKNKITLEEIKDILSLKGQTTVYEKSHQCFNAGKTEFSDHKEFVFITKVGTGDGK
ncbi:MULTISPECIES: DNA adenine methylase [Blautia]|uniref:site-specific DNA-methyltransferase (adenine-specific) n=1 Tax=Blautia argi TaxID=1912897 RepID=A0A2Z4UD78_9FIRM|nr:MULTISPECIES: DNA adenine methylase [Blautia]AWY99035.1 adenine methyltransferase [Blautia argi]